MIVNFFSFPPPFPFLDMTRGERGDWREKKKFFFKFFLCFCQMCHKYVFVFSWMNFSIFFLSHQHFLRLVTNSTRFFPPVPHDQHWIAHEKKGEKKKPFHSAFFLLYTGHKYLWLKRMCFHFSIYSSLFMSRDGKITSTIASLIYIYIWYFIPSFSPSSSSLFSPLLLPFERRKFYRTTLCVRWILSNSPRNFLHSQRFPFEFSTKKEKEEKKKNMKINKSRMQCERCEGECMYMIWWKENGGHRVSIATTMMMMVIERCFCVRQNWKEKKGKKI